METVEGAARESTRESALRERARKRIQDRRDFHRHLAIYLLVNGMLVGIWAVVTPDVFFWPIFPILGWGIGVIMHGWETYADQEITDAEIAREVERLHGK